MWRQIWEVILTVGNWLAIPSVVAWVLYDRRRIDNEARQGHADAEVAEKIAPDRIKSSSIMTLEAEILALQQSFNADRKIKDDTIRWLKEQLEEARLENMEKDRLIDKMQEQVSELKTQVRNLSGHLDRVQKDLDRVRSIGHHGED